MFPARIPGINASARTTRAGPAKTTHPGRSRSVRGTGPAASVPVPWRFIPWRTAASEEYMVGSARATVTIPAAATAPAPI